MLIKKVLVSALFAAGMIAAVATPLPSVAAVGVYVNIAPPPARSERVPAPRRGYVWSPGYWNWQGKKNKKHVWVKGSWVRERQGYSYQPHRWIERDGRWNLERGRWNQARSRDSDRDGIPDRRDARPNDPNRR